VRNLAKQYEETCPKHAFDYYQLVYETDKAMGASCLGHCYETGIGVDRSLETAIQYYKIAYECGLESPCFHLGRCFEELGTKENLRQAINYYQIGAHHENDQCQYRLAELFEQGKGLSQSFEQAFHYYTLAARNGYSKAWARVGRCFANGIGTEKSEENAFNAYQEGAASNCIESRYQLAICYLNGLGVSKSVQKGIDHLLIVLKAGHREAPSKLAETLEKCQGIEDTNSNILSLGQRFKRLADRYSEVQSEFSEGRDLCLRLAGEMCSVDDAESQCELGIYYNKLDNEKAFFYFKLAADQGHAPAQYALGKFFALGKGCTQSWEQAVKYFQQAADQGNAQGVYELGYCYEKGLGIKQSYSLAFEYFKLAAERGYQRANCALGLYYERGLGVEKSFNKAFHHFHLAADQKDAEGQYHVARFYRLGRRFENIALSMQEAIRYYELALNQGFRKKRLPLFIKSCKHFIQQYKQSPTSAQHHFSKKNRRMTNSAPLLVSSVHFQLLRLALAD